MDEPTLQQELHSLDQAISHQLKILNGKFTAQRPITELVEEAAKVRELLETRSRLNKVREQASLE